MKRLLVCLILLLAPTVAGADELRIFAASSLTEPLGEAATVYGDRHPGVRIRLHFAGSQTLAAQIEQGAPADLFIAASQDAMARLERAGLVEQPAFIARNRLVLAVTADMAEQIRTPADLARPGLLLVVGNPQVPIGAYTRRLFERLAGDPGFGAARVAAIRNNVVSEETQVKAIVAKLLLGEADAGIVYQSDLTAPAARRLVGRAFPCGDLPVARYPAAVLTGGNRRPAREFLAFLATPPGTDIMRRHGFLPPGDGP
ncbi:molybdate transport system substrate-binding protein [Geothermobacter ehrlichii]|uniref:Molybdate transport system substrate-binding protein n=1 Tax=Geothermobacter ehrlichii TaxID=213224 RepID=A0A5D3WJE0_9BACT|nr:molybdate ABC transporter substrate-binding protein [Geothermobacter ehrlichii]TYO96693.1 molybdate transport system substrate-binding protein [Geothermobacter ehrlichii]